MGKVIAVLALYMTGETLTVPFVPLFALPLIPLMKPLTARRGGRMALAVPVIPCAAVTAAAAASRLAVFAGAVSLPKTPVWLLAGITLAAALYVASGEAEAVLKWAGFTLPLTLGFIALAAVLLAGKLQAEGLDVPRVWAQNPALMICEGITLTMLIPALGYTKKPVRAYLFALSAALGIGAAVWVLSGLTLGAGLAGSVAYPFHHALRVAKGGELIGRVEAFLIPVALCVTVLKAAACMAVIAFGVRAYLPPSSAMASKVRLPETAPET
ncbi:MAG: hypothetical protein FWG72_02150 [Oscillospiraceae bacterium]|nr:hypothetical protein [Oscillospiraceae bacterium]